MMDKPTTYRDEALGALLREIEAPEHRPEFHAELHRRLAEERVASLAAARRGRRARQARVRWALRVGAVVAVVGIVFVAIGLPRTERTPRVAGPETATAAEIRAEVRKALAAIRNLGGVVVHDGPERGDELRWRFTLTARGDFRIVGPSDVEAMTYDSAIGVARSAMRSASVDDETLFYAVRRGVAPGLPDPGPPTWVIPGEFGAYVRALLAAEDPRVRVITYQGRPAWRLEVDTVPNAIVPEYSGDRFEITVDQETGVPVRVLETKDEAFLEEIMIEELVVDADLPADAFELAFPPDAEVMESDDGFRRVALEKVAGVVSYRPLVPAWTPDGYKLAEVAVAREAGPTGKESGNPPSRMVVSLSYRRGIDQFLVTTRLASGPAERWSDPLATGEGFVDESESVAVRDGALAGETAELVVVPRGIPHLWALTDRLVVTVGGDLSRAELVRVAESLRAR